MIYVFYTWFFANLFHPIVLYFYYTPNGFIDAESFLSGIPIFLYLLIFSLPALLCTMVFVHYLVRIPGTRAFKFIMMLTGTPLMILINFYIICLLFGLDNISRNDLEMIIPAIIATELTILIRYSYFFKMLDTYEQNKNDALNKHDLHV